MSSGCKRCGICCKTQVVSFANIHYDEKWVEGRMGTIKGEYVYVPSRCKWLMEDNLCEMHGKDKPKFCVAWPDSVGPQPWLLNMGCKYFD